MLFPIIKVKDGDSVHIVGTNNHDLLYLDEQSGGIQYLNLQCCEGTKKRCGKASMEFVHADLEEWDMYPRIEMVTIEDLVELATKNMVEQTEARIRLHELFKKYLEEKELCEEKLKDDDISDTSGMLF